MKQSNMLGPLKQNVDMTELSVTQDLNTSERLDNVQQFYTFSNHGSNDKHYA